MIVAIEGIDASGKCTQSKLLAAKLGAMRLTFPEYTTPAGKLIAAHLRKEWKCSPLRYGEENGPLLDARVFQILQTVNRYELLPMIDELRAHDRSIVFDRYFASGLVYGAMDGLDVKWLEGIQCALPEPDAWILIDVPIEESKTRRPERRDRYEADNGFIERVRREYLRLFNEKRRATMREGAKPNSAWHVVDGCGTVEEVHARICRALALPLDYRAPNP